MKLYIMVPVGEVTKEMALLAGAFVVENLRKSTSGICLLGFEAKTWEDIPKGLRQYKLIQEADIRTVLRGDDWKSRDDELKPMGFFGKLLS